MLDAKPSDRAFDGLKPAEAKPANVWLHIALLGLGASAAGCLDAEPEQLSYVESAATVGSYTTTGCSTAVVVGLSKQIAQEADCAAPGSFASFTATGGITFTSNAVLPFLEKGARDHLKQVAATAPLQINSALRTVAQQYLLYRWYLGGRCGITAAATPGRSNHEGGRAVDIANYSSRITAMANKGWAHDVPGDPVHFDHLASPDNRGKDVAAFQRLWNRNNPNDKIAVDGAYGPQTEARLRAAPATGFPLGATCGNFAHDLDVVSIDGPDIAQPQTRVHYSIIVVNSGAVPWPASTKLELASGATSELHDASWISDKVVTTLDQVVQPNAQVAIDFDVTTPAATVETPVSQVFHLDDAGTNFGQINLALTVMPNMDGDMSGDGSEEGEESGGCNASGGSAGWLAFVLPAIVLRRRRR